MATCLCCGENLKPTNSTVIILEGKTLNGGRKTEIQIMKCPCGGVAIE